MPYAGHIMRVMAAGRTMDEKIVGVRVYIIGMGHLSHRCNGRASFYTKDLIDLIEDTYLWYNQHKKMQL